MFLVISGSVFHYAQVFPGVQSWWMVTKGAPVLWVVSFFRLDTVYGFLPLHSPSLWINIWLKFVLFLLFIGPMSESSSPAQDVKSGLFILDYLIDWVKHRAQNSELTEQIC